MDNLSLDPIIMRSELPHNEHTGYSIHAKTIYANKNTTKNINITNADPKNFVLIRTEATSSITALVIISPVNILLLVIIFYVMPKTTLKSNNISISELENNCTMNYKYH